MNVLWHLVIFLALGTIGGLIMDLLNKHFGHPLYNFPAKKAYVLTFTLITADFLIGYLLAYLIVSAF